MRRSYIATIVFAVFSQCTTNTFDAAEGDTLSVAQAIRVYQEKSALWIDARWESAYRSGHIPGALNFPAFLADSLMPAFRAAHPDTTRIVAYCSGRTCDDSHDMAILLRKAGYAHVKIFPGGFLEWRKASMPTKSTAPNAGAPN